MAHDKKRCPNPHSVYKRLKKAGEDVDEYQVWKAKYMRKADMKKHRFQRYMRQLVEDLPDEEKLDSCKKVLHGLFKAISKDMRKSFMVQRSEADDVTADLFFVMGNPQVLETPDIDVRNTVGFVNTISDDTHPYRRRPNPMRVYRSLKEQGLINPDLPQPQWKAAQIKRSGGFDKPHRLRRLMRALEQTLNGGRGPAIMKLLYVSKLRKTIQDLAQRMISKGSTSDDAFHRVFEIIADLGSASTIKEKYVAIGAREADEAAGDDF